MDGDKEMRLRYAGTCVRCGQEIPQGVQAVYNSALRSVRHLDCNSELDRGVAGASARREHERRRARDEANVARQKAAVEAKFGSGLVGKVATLIAVDDRPVRRTEVWAQGAVGEERVAAALERLAEVGVITLHDRRIRGTVANIDHIAVTPWGIWVIDAKRYLDKRPALVIEGGFFGVGGTPHLTVGGRKEDKLVDGVLRQVERVRVGLDASIPVRGALAFVEADWPLIGGDFTIREVAVVWPRRLAKLLLRQEVPTVDVNRVVNEIAARFPPS